MRPEFDTTQWSIIVTARGKDAVAARDALARLCEAYWRPIYVFLRRKGYRVEDAEDLTQALFSHLLEKDFLATVTPEAGRFRSFLLASLENLLTDQRRREHALKRGRGVAPVSFDAAAAESLLREDPADERTPEVLFERRWALTVLERALDRAREDARRRGTARRFEALKGFLAESSSAPRYEHVARDLGITVEAVAVAVHRLRKRYGEALREEIGQTVSSPGEIDDEIRHLLAAVVPGG